MREEGIYIAAFLVCLAAFGCTSKKAAPAELEQAAAEPTAEPEAAPSEPVAVKDPVVEAEEIFNARCVTCHGEKGKGDGPGSAALNPKPRDYTSVEWQKSVTDEHIKTIIIGGGTAVGLSPLMPPNPDLTDKPEVVAALVAVVRNLGDE
ncbi:MAG: c-type cytochrome [Myxococcales bacterium]|nr:c-type cytochrome [Myxococcales bacterium]MDH3484419.1 c-type cytochrome [Myxococcales bacterium]